jgi:mannose-1-phosphate guanylyltransferase
MPKQFVKLFDEKSLFQLTVERNAKICESHFIVSNSEQYFLALDQLEELNRTNNNYLLEPVGRNTAPAIALACMVLPEDETVLVTPSDHLIKNEEAYRAVLKRAQELAEEDNLVTFGITPTFAETGFGYIEANGEDVEAFHEKPDEETAQSYLNAGNYYWNSGMFMFKAGIFLEELQKYAPEIYEASKKAVENAKNDDMVRILHDDMINIPQESIDYAVMEKSLKVKVVPSNIEWSDVGSFDALYEEMPKDENKNTLNSNHIAVQSSGNLVYSKERKIATVGVKDLIIVDTGDALLVTKKGNSQQVKDVVKILKEESSELPNIHLTGYRPWGTYTILEDTAGYKIKRIEVKPGKRLSLQKHHHRNEHWIVVSGTATVTVGDKKYLVRPNESTYIKMGEVHRLENEGKIPVILIEAQVGEYTGEDDIVRLEDDFSRK